MKLRRPDLIPKPDLTQKADPIPKPDPVHRPPADRRLHDRLEVDFPVCLCWQDSQGNQVLPARAADISKFGLRVEADKPVPPGTALSVQTKLTMLGTACVRHCTPKGLNYSIGLHMPDRLERNFQVKRAKAGGQVK
jgi:hypothetical protein